MKKIDEIIKEFIEKGADLEHDRWARWQNYMHSKLETITDENGDPIHLILPIELANRWNRQIATKYTDLSEAEKESDRKETRNYLPLLHQALTDYKEEILKLITEEIAQAHLEGDKTSRLTSLFNKIQTK